MESNEKVISINKYFYDKKKNPNNILVYHYTSAEALLNILDDNISLRFTDCAYLNDKQEFNYIQQIVEYAFEELNGIVNNLDSFDLYSGLTYNDCYKGSAVSLGSFGNEYRNIYGWMEIRYYVFCTSTKSDSLNMWNYYVKNNSYQGYNIGFEVNDLTEYIGSVIKNNNLNTKLFYGSIEYDQKKQVELVKHIIIDSYNQKEKELANVKIEDYDDGDEYSSAIDEISRSAIYRISEEIDKLRLFFKHVSFVEEKEQRFVIAVPTKDIHYFSVGHHTKNGIICPHIDIQVNKKDLIREIYIGPTLENRIAKMGLSSLLESNGYDMSKDNNFKISVSKIPIRY